VIVSYNGAMNTQAAKQQRSPGRPREFDIDAAVDAAMAVFRNRGFHEASMQDLGSAMGLTPGSIYKAFGGKREIFLAAVERYRAQRSEQLRQRLATRATAKEKIADALRFYAESASGAEGKMGCLIVGAVVDLSTLDGAVVDRVTDIMARNEGFLRETIMQGHADGSVPDTVDPAATATALNCMMQGMRVIGKLGRSGDEMTEIVAQVMKLLD
jgi:TetR/AcrR family transcriptional repressor of nem operon